MEAPGHKTADVATEVALFLVSFVLSFLTAGPALFADGATGERFIAAAIEAVALLALGALAGALAPMRWRQNARWTTFGALATPVFFTVTGRLWSQPIMLLLAVTLVSGAAAGAHLGCWLGALVRLRLRMGPPQAPERGAGPSEPRA